MQPPFLQHGDKIAIISPSSAIDSKLVYHAISILREWGLEPILGRHALNLYGRFAGTKQERMEDLQWAVDSTDIKAIICSRGGYGLIQIIDDIDFSHFELYPKWVVGFSDITILHSAIAGFGISSIQASMAKYLCENSTSAELLRRSLFGEFPTYNIPTTPLNRTGVVTSDIIGGNLSVFFSLRGTHYEPDFRQKILFIEDIGEKPYQIDRMLHNFKLGGIFEDIAGLIVGRFSDYEEDPGMGCTLHELIADIVKEYDFPICFNFPAGHDPLHYPLPFGIRTTLIVDNENVTLNFASNINSMN
jgi:muramoyltetrapeptide carboxypeptidase